MKTVKTISAILLGMILLVSTSGYMLYKTNCTCTGEEQVSMFVTPESCETEFHQHHKHSKYDETEVSCSADECHECTPHADNCGCESPEFFFFKLKDKAIDEEVKFIKVQPVMIVVADVDIFSGYTDDLIVLEEETKYIDPPPKLSSSLEFLIHIQQLKIPTLA